VTDHHKQYQIAFPNERLKPKHHFLVHYGCFIAETGPLVHKWAMRFEGKHRFFKRIPAVIPNFKNITKTFAYQHYLSQFFHWRGGSCLKSTQCGPGTEEYIAHMPGSNAIESVPDLIFNGQVFCANRVEKFGTKYTMNMTVVNDYNQCVAYPEFVRIAKILPCRSGSVYLLLEAYATIGFDDHYHVYILNCSKSDWVLKEVEDLVDYHPVSSDAVRNEKTCSNELMIALRYLLFI
jgi:hypothetical protein